MFSDSILHLHLLRISYNLGFSVLFYSAWVPLTLFKADKHHVMCTNSFFSDAFCFNCHVSYISNQLVFLQKTFKHLHKAVKKISKTRLNLNHEYINGNINLFMGILWATKSSISQVNYPICIFHLMVRSVTAFGPLSSGSNTDKGTWFFSFLFNASVLYNFCLRIGFSPFEGYKKNVCLLAHTVSTCFPVHSDENKAWHLECVSCP